MLAWNEGRGEGNGIEQKHGREDIDRKQETDRNRFRSRQIGRHTMIKIETMREAATEEIERQTHGQVKSFVRMVFDKS